MGTVALLGFFGWIYDGPVVTRDGCMEGWNGMEWALDACSNQLFTVRYGRNGRFLFCSAYSP